MRFFELLKTKIIKNKTIGPLVNSVRNILRDFRKQINNENFKRRASYASYWKHKKIKEDQILYEAFMGRGMFCNPYAIFLELLNDPRADQMKHIWVLDNLKDNQPLINDYKNYSNVSFIQYNSKEYRKALCTSKYLINNGTFPTYFTKKPDQIYINTWHGIPLKTLGFDMPNGNTESSNTLRNFMQADYLFSTSPAVTDLMFKNAYKLNDLYSGKIVEEGYPRLDTLFRFERDEILDKLLKYGVDFDPNRKIILYAPTWRGETFRDPSSDISYYYALKDTLEQNIDLMEYQILIKVHHVMYQSFKENLKEGFFIPPAVDANEVLSVTDVLITDYSSIYFDFLATGKPVLFYIPDLAEYKKERGIYKSVNQLPGPVTSDYMELANWINDIEHVAANWKSAYERERKWSGAVSDGKITERIVNGIFFRQPDDKYAIYKLPKSEKKKILFLRDDLRTNGITTSFMNLMNNFDYDRFDVSALITKSKEIEGQNRIQQMPSEVRVFYRNSTFNMTRWEYFKYLIHMEFGYKKYNTYEMKREFLRSFGNAKFDYIMDFNGYNRFFSILALQDPDAKTAIWLHNDMLNEYFTRNKSLNVTFKLYPQFDYLISCTREIMEVNKEKLSERYGLDKRKFRYAKNFMDSSQLNDALKESSLEQYDNRQFIKKSEENNYGQISIDLVRIFPDDEENDGKIYRFITIGRMSPEKNQINLIKAFAKLHKQMPNTILYILGDGPLRSKMEKQVASLGCKEAIIMTGNVTNPYIIMKYCDCFILPSLYEGQGMVVLEARMLHMPIIVSKFDAVESVSVYDGQLYIGTNKQDIYEGLKSFIKGQVPIDYEFDIKQYNQEAWNEFLQAIGEEQPQEVK